MNENEAIIIGIGIIASLVGLLEFGRRTILEAALERQQLTRIIELVTRIKKVEEHLEDVLSHPDDSGFGTKWLKEEIEDIKISVKAIEHNQLNYIKSGIERIEKLLDKHGN